MKLKMLLIVFSLFFSSLSLAQWSDNSEVNKLLSADLNRSVLPKIAICPNGNYYVSWNYDDNLNYSTYLNYFDKNGYQLWEAPLLISDHKTRTWITDYSLVADDENCAIVAFQDIRNYDEESDASDVFVYRISPTGQFLWGNDGINLTPNDNLFTASPVVCITKAGNYIVAWNAAEQTFRDSIPDKCMVYVSKLNKDGDILWDNPIILQDTLTQYFFPNIIASGADDFIMQWIQYPIIENPMPGKISWRHIYAQRYGENGSPIWSNDVAIFDTIGIPPGTYLIPESKSDSNDGIIVVWRIGKGYVINIKAQHITSDGIEKWEHNGINVCADEDLDQDYPSFDYNPIDKSLYVFWLIDYYDDEELMYYIGLYGNLINENGERMWEENGKEFISPIAEIEPFPFVHQVKLGKNDVIVLFSMSNKQTPDDGRVDTLKAMLIDKNGKFVWDTKEINVCSNPSFKMHHVLSEFRNDQWIAVWGDSRNTMIIYNQDIYGQNINYDGTIGIKGTSVEEKGNLSYKLYPNPAKDFIYLLSFNKNTKNIYNFDGTITYSIFNTLGECLTKGNVSDENLMIGISQLPNGIYFIQIGEEKHIFVKI